MDEIIYTKKENEEHGYEWRDTNETNRTKYCQPANNTLPVAQRKICDIYRWKTTMSPAYLNNQQEMENELRLWEYSWYRMGNIMKTMRKAS